MMLPSGSDIGLRHCEAPRAVAIHVIESRLMDCFVPRNDGAGVQ